MTDDQDVQKKATRRMGAVRKPGDSEAELEEGWNLGDEAGEDSPKSVDVMRESTEMKTVREVPITASPDEPEDAPSGDDDAESRRRRRDSSHYETVREAPITKSPDAECDEKTAMIDREELIRQTARDQQRGQNRQDKETVRMETPFPFRDDDEEMASSTPESPVDKTHEMNLLEQTTRPVVPTDHDPVTVDGTDEFARHGITTVEDDDKATFPARVDEQLRIVIPPDVVLETDVDPGDLVVVKLKKVD